MSSASHVAEQGATVDGTGTLPLELAADIRTIGTGVLRHDRFVRSPRRGATRARSAARALLPDSFVTFEPEAIHVMLAAFETAWLRLRKAGHICTSDRYADDTRHQLASRVIAIAADGNLDPLELGERALAALFPLGLET